MIRIIVVVFLLVLGIYPEQTIASVGTVSFVKGRAFLTYPDAGKKEKRARRGLSLNIGEGIRTERGAYAKITMEDKNIFHIGPESAFVLENYDNQVTGDQEGKDGVQESKLSVLYGKVRTALEQKYDDKNNRFRVRTEAAVLGVRGTDFLTEHSAVTGQTRIITFEGLVGVTGISPEGLEAGTKILRSGEMLLVSAGESPLNPVVLPESVLESINTGAKRPQSSHSFKGEGEKKLSKPKNLISSGRRVNNLLQRPQSRRRVRNLLDRNIISSGASKAKVNININDQTP